MGVEVETLFYDSPSITTHTQQQQSPYEHHGWLLEDQTVRAKTKSLDDGTPTKKNKSQPGQLHKSRSVCFSTSAPVLPTLNGSLSLEDHLLETMDDNQHQDESLRARQRQQIMQRADEIMLGKRQVGMQVGEICPVCLVDDVDTKLSNCGHTVHAKCIKRWIQSASNCPVCRESVTGIEEAYSEPESVLYHPFEKDVSEERISGKVLSIFDNQANNNAWGWFEEFEEMEDLCHEDHSTTRRRHHSHSHSLADDPAHHSTSPVINRDLSTTFEVCRTFPPLRLEYDIPYKESKHEFMRTLPHYRHIAAKIQIRSFRIVEAKNKSRYAEYLIEVQLDRRCIRRWRRFAHLTKFANTLESNQYRRALATWDKLEGSSRWFNRLELSYLHARCRLLEEFAHSLLQESTTAHPLADLLAG